MTAFPHNSQRDHRCPVARIVGTPHVVQVGPCFAATNDLYWNTPTARALITRIAAGSQSAMNLFRPMIAQISRKPSFHYCRDAMNNVIP